MGDSKQAVCEALRDLAQSQPLASISIAGVCDKAGLSRKTFSRNFADLRDVVRHQMFLDFVQPVSDLMRIMSSTAFDSVTVLERNLNVLKSNRSYYEEVIDFYGSAWFVEQVSQLTFALDFQPYSQHDLDPIELDFVENYLANAMASVMRWWINHGMEMPERKVAQMSWDWLYAHFRELESS